MSSSLAVKDLIPHTWPLFFARYGRFTAVQEQAIPPILQGQDALVISATASGKTEAVLAPLLERLWPNLQSPNLQSPNLQSPNLQSPNLQSPNLQSPNLQSPNPQSPNLRILYICPTRALVRDLYERLAGVLTDTAVSVGMKTGDTRPGTMPAILITTPESTDSLLTRSARQFGGLEAVVLDEVHLFDNTPRGDQLRCLLARLAHIRQYARPGSSPVQRVALSATVPDPAGIAQRYLNKATLIIVPGGRTLAADIVPLYDLDELVLALQERATFKSLVFCNARSEVEETADYLRQHLPYHAEVFVHYGNLSATMRRDVEERFASAATAICVCTSTLELGVDIGSVDEVVLMGTPPDLNAFLQRTGRGGRRTAESRVLCMPRSPSEWARFEALVSLANAPISSPHSPISQSPISSPHSPIAQSPIPAYTFRPSILIQQIFSLIKQSPTGGVRLADVRRVAPLSVTSEAIRKMVGHLVGEGYLQPGRIGEWKPDEKLQELLDKHEIYSNIGAEVGAVQAVDAHTGQTMAYTTQTYPAGVTILFGGQPMRVVWSDRYRFGLTPTRKGTPIDGTMRFAKTYSNVPFRVTQAVAGVMGLRPGEMVWLAQAKGGYLFHFWGTLWGLLLASYLQANGYFATFVNEFTLQLPAPLAQLPPPDPKHLHTAAQNVAVTYGKRLNTGRFHPLLPPDISLQTRLAHLSLPQFEQQYSQAHLITQPHLAEQLHALVSGGRG